MKLIIGFSLILFCVDRHQSRADDKECDIRMWYINMLAHGMFDKTLTENQHTIKNKVEEIIKKSKKNEKLKMIDCHVLSMYEDMFTEKSEDIGTNMDDEKQEDETELDDMDIGDQVEIYEADSSVDNNAHFEKEPCEECSEKGSGDIENEPCETCSNKDVDMAIGHSEENFANKLQVDTQGSIGTQSRTDLSAKRPQERDGSEVKDSEKNFFSDDSTSTEEQVESDTKSDNKQVVDDQKQETNTDSKETPETEITTDKHEQDIQDNKMELVKDSILSETHAEDICMSVSCPQFGMCRNKYSHKIDIFDIVFFKTELDSQVNLVATADTMHCPLGPFCTSQCFYMLSYTYCLLGYTLSIVTKSTSATQTEKDKQIQVNEVDKDNDLMAGEAIVHSQEEVVEDNYVEEKTDTDQSEFDRDDDQSIDHEKASSDLNTSNEEFEDNESDKNTDDQFPNVSAMENDMVNVDDRDMLKLDQPMKSLQRDHFKESIKDDKTKTTTKENEESRAYRKIEHNFEIFDKYIKSKTNEFAIKMQGMEMMIMKLENQLLSEKLNKQNHTNTIDKLDNHILRLENHMLKLDQSYTELKAENEFFKKRQSKYLELAHEGSQNQTSYLELTHNASKSLQLIGEQQNRIAELSELLMNQTNLTQQLVGHSNDLAEQNKKLYDMIMNQSFVLSELAQNIEKLNKSRNADDKNQNNAIIDNVLKQIEEMKQTYIEKNEDIAKTMKFKTQPEETTAHDTISDANSEEISSSFHSSHRSQSSTDEISVKHDSDKVTSLSKKTRTHQMINWCSSADDTSIICWYSSVLMNTCPPYSGIYWDSCKSQVSEKLDVGDRLFHAIDVSHTKEIPQSNEQVADMSKPDLPIHHLVQKESIESSDEINDKELTIKDSISHTSDNAVIEPTANINTGTTTENTAHEKETKRTAGISINQDNVTKESVDNSVRESSDDDPVQKSADDDSVQKSANDDDSVQKIPDNDSVQKSADDESIQKSADDESIQKSSDDESIQKSSDDESIQKSADDESIQKSADDESIQKSADDESIQKSADDELIQKSADDESIQKSADDESIQKSADDESIQKSSDDESIQKSADDESIQKSADDESIQKSADDESIQKSADDDSIQKSADDESIQKSADDESIQKSADDESIQKSADDESIQKSADDESIQKSADDESIQKSADDESIQKSADDELIQKSADDESIQKSADDESIQKSADDESIQKSADDESIQKSADDDSIQKSSDDESIQKSADDESIQKSADDESIQKSADDESIQKSADDESIQKSADDESIQKSADDDSVLKSNNDDSVLKSADHDSVQESAHVNSSTDTYSENRINIIQKSIDNNSVKEPEVNQSQEENTKDDINSEPDKSGEDGDFRTNVNIQSKPDSPSMSTQRETAGEQTDNNNQIENSKNEINIKKSEGSLPVAERAKEQKAIDNTRPQESNSETPSAKPGQHVDQKKFVNGDKKPTKQEIKDLHREVMKKMVASQEERPTAPGKGVGPKNVMPVKSKVDSTKPERIRRISHAILYKRSSPEEEIDCFEIYRKKEGRAKNGVYKIWPAGLNKQVQVYCDMNRGGWTVIQRRDDGITDFFRDWNEYKKGFGAAYADHYIGNDLLHHLTTQGHYSLRVDIMNWERERKFAHYHYVMVESEKEGYKLHIDGYSGDAGDGLSKHDEQKFSTKDVDNDKVVKEFGGSCAKRFHGAGWYYKCYMSNLNGKYYKSAKIPDKMYDGITWKPWTGSSYSLKSAEVKIRPISAIRDQLIINKAKDGK